MLVYIMHKSIALLIVSILLYGLSYCATNIISVFILLELLLLFLVGAFVNISNLQLASFGAVFAVEIIGLAAIKAALGLVTIVAWVKHRGTLNVL